MKIVIIGAGKVGYSLARMLSSDEHDVIVVEPDIERGNIINEKLNVQVVNGNGASPRLQRAIGIGNADLVVAVTDRDEINMLSCTFAKQAGAKRTVARLRDIEYANDIAALRRLMPEVDVFINPEQVTAEVISNYIRIPEAKNIYYFDKRKLMMVELPVAVDSLVNGKALKDLPKIKPFLITSILRDGRFIIPNGNEIIRENDYIFLMTRTRGYERDRTLAGLQAQGHPGGDDPWRRALGLLSGEDPGANGCAGEDHRAESQALRISLRHARYDDCLKRRRRRCGHSR